MYEVYEMHKGGQHCTDCHSLCCTSLCFVSRRWLGLGIYNVIRCHCVGHKGPDECWEVAEHGPGHSFNFSRGGTWGMEATDWRLA